MFGLNSLTRNLLAKLRRPKPAYVSGDIARTETYSISGKDAMERLYSSKSRDLAYYPHKNFRFTTDGSGPRVIQPKFGIEADEQIFTMGSSFMREIEWALRKVRVFVPVTYFGIQMPKGKPTRTLDLLNEYNVGSIAQRINSSIGRFVYGPDVGIEQKDQGFTDLFLDVDDAISRALLAKRRNDVTVLYQQITKSSTIIVSLVCVESWYDQEHSCFLNQHPSENTVELTGSRFIYKRLSLDDTIKILSSCIDNILALAPKKIVLMISPQPLRTTFTKECALLANSYSKSVLRLAVEHLKNSYKEVDYFPSYEILALNSASSFGEDNFAMQNRAIQEASRQLIDVYFAGQRLFKLD